MESNNSLDGKNRMTNQIFEYLSNFCVNELGSLELQQQMEQKVKNRYNVMMDDKGSWRGGCRSSEQEIGGLIGRFNGVCELMID